MFHESALSLLTLSSIGCPCLALSLAQGSGLKGSWEEVWAPRQQALPAHEEML